jgi:hypothetical protein
VRDEKTASDAVAATIHGFHRLDGVASNARYPSGGRTTVIVNGTTVVENAAHTGAMPGVVLRRGADGQVG